MLITSNRSIGEWGTVLGDAVVALCQEGARAPCCTRDEGRSFEVGNQVLISSHRKLLSLKATVVNVAEKPEQDFGRHD